MTPQFARRLLAASLALGILADWLLRAAEPRAGFVTLVLAALGVALFASARGPEADPAVRRERRLLIGAAAALALLLVLRDAEMLRALDLFALLVTLWLVAWRALGRPLAQLVPRDALIGVGAGAAAVVGGAPTLALRDADAAALEKGARRSYAGFGIGAVIALPVLLIVTSLLAEADPLFAAAVDETSLLLDGRIVNHLIGIGAATWVAAGALRGALVPVGLAGASFRREWRIPFASVVPLLGGLSLLLAIWIGLQLRTLFGGAEYVAATTGVTVAEYARRGFFELIVLAGIVLAVLLVTDDLLDRTADAARRSFHALGTVLVGLVGAVLVSAVLRLGLYLRYFGLTEDRVLALAILVWVALMLGWFALTVLRGARARFAPGVLVISAVWLGALNLANPERWVVATNLGRAERGLEFDVAYHAKLSGDALPALLRGADRLGPERAAELRAAIAAEWTRRAAVRDDWREWSLPYALGRGRATP